ncbi:kelch-like protein 29 [Argopecten irradians]|uniref:kelch-like protein 29 n=1 Tax=Argopecten irradians TaxID=31199 RepID=UPI003720D969
MIWFKHDTQKRYQYLAEIFQHVRLPYVSKNIYSEFMDRCDFHEEPDVKPFVEEAESYKNYPSCQMEELSSRTRLRQHYDMEKVILVIGYKQRITCTDPCMWVWRFGLGQWYTLNSSPAKLGDGYATCRYGKSEVFFCGGQGKRTFLKFDGLTDTILPCTQMPAARMSHCMVCVGDAIYVLGGTGFQYDKEQACLVEDRFESVEQWRSFESQWQQCGHIMSAVSGATACASGSLILIYGGYIDKNDKEPSDTAQFFDTKTNTCGYLANHLPFRYGNLKSVSVKGVTYILTNSELFQSNCKDESGYNYVQTLKDKFDCQNYRSLSSAMASDGNYLFFLKECFSTRIAMYDETSWDLRRYDIETREIENASENIQFLKSSVSMYTLVVGKSVLQDKSVVQLNSK